MKRTYEYRCPKCHTLFETKHNIHSLPSHMNCPECGTRSTRIIRSSPVIYNCKGFYCTDKE